MSTTLLVVSDASDDSLSRELEALGVPATIVSSPGEAFYLLEDPAAPFSMLIVNGDEPDRVQLLAYLRDSRPLLRRVLIVRDAGRITIDDDCIVIEHAERREMLAVLLGR
jgi:hypothetical protein